MRQPPPFSAERLTKEIIAMQLFPDDSASPLEAARVTETVGGTLAALDQALALDTPELFEDYIRWYEILRQSREVSETPSGAVLQALQTILAADQAQDVLQQLQPYLQRAETALDLDENGHSSFLRPDQPYAVEAAAYFQTVTRGSRRETIALLNQFVQAAIPVKDMYLFIFQPVQREVGRLWQLNRIGIPQEHFATHLTRMAMAQLAPMVVSSNRNGYSLLAASVGRELHDLGLRMVADFFEMDGWECYYLGANSPLEAIVQGVQAQQPQLLALSATISTQLNQVAEIIRQVRLEAGPGLKILVGGYPFNVAPAAWQRVGADGYAADADSAVREGYRLVS